MTTMLAGADLVNNIPPALAARYNTAALQRERILECLRRAGPRGVLSRDLADLCDVRCVTKRVSELRREGHPIDSERDFTESDHGVNVCARYVLTAAGPVQGDLFSNAANKASRS